MNKPPRTVGYSDEGGNWMRYEVRLEALAEKDYLVAKGFVELGGSTPDAYAAQEELYQQWLADDTAGRLQKASGADKLFVLFCHTCVLDEQTGGYICGNDLAGEITKDAVADEFDTIHLFPSEYAVFTCELDEEQTITQAYRALDDMYWGEWLPAGPYESNIETTTGANTPGIACISLRDGARLTVWYPVRRKETA